jgi:hypothetical protein
MKTVIAACGSAFLLALAPEAWACGVCVEDKVAATYDFAVVQRAAAQGRVVVFCELKGPIQAAKIRKAATEVRGVDRASVRISGEPGALSFVIDPARQSPEAAVMDLQRQLPDIRVGIVRLMHPKD